jgi:hypothetical protein
MPLRVEIASSVFSGADAQIGSADYRLIKSPLTGLAEKWTVVPVCLNCRSWPLSDYVCWIKRDIYTSFPHLRLSPHLLGTPQRTIRRIES